MLRPIEEPEDLADDATTGELLQRAQEGRLGIQEANERFRALRILYGMEVHGTENGLGLR